MNWNIVFRIKILNMCATNSLENDENFTPGH